MENLKIVLAHPWRWQQNLVSPDFIEGIDALRPVNDPLSYVNNEWSLKIMDNAL